MVEAVAASLKLKLDEWFSSVEEIEAVEDWEWSTMMQRKIQAARNLRTFLNGDWKENLETRNRYQSVEEVRSQQVALVGGENILKRLGMKIKKKVADPFFLKDQLRLFKFRMDFFFAFFPRQAQLYDTVGTMGFYPRVVLVEERFGWWNCKGAGYFWWRPEHAIVGKDFHNVVRTAFHMNGTEVDFDDLQETEYSDEDFDDLEEEDFEEEIEYMGEGQDYHKRFDLLFADRSVEEEIDNLKAHCTIYEDEHMACVGNNFKLLKQVVWALHKPGPPLLQELVAKTIHLHFPEDVVEQELPSPLLKYLVDGPKPDPAQLSTRGKRIWNALVQEEQDRQADLEQEMRMDREEELELRQDFEIEEEEKDRLAEREMEMDRQERLIELEEGDMDIKIYDYQNSHGWPGWEEELEEEEFEEEMNQLVEREMEIERLVELEEGDLDIKINDYQNSLGWPGWEEELEEEKFEEELEEEEMNQLVEREMEIERLVELEEGDLDIKINDYQNSLGWPGWEEELEEEFDLLKESDRDWESEIKMERQIQLQKEEEDRKIEDYQNFHESAYLDVELDQEESDREGETKMEQQLQLEGLERRIIDCQSSQGRPGREEELEERDREGMIQVEQQIKHWEEEQDKLS